MRDIHVTVIRNPEPKKPKVHEDWATHWSTMYLLMVDELARGAFDDTPRRRRRLDRITAQGRVMMFAHPLSKKPEQEKVDMGEGIHAKSLELTLNYLNQRSTPLREVLRSPDGLYHLNDTVWAEKVGNAVMLHNSNMQMGVLEGGVRFKCPHTNPVVTLACNRIVAEILQQERIHV